MGQAVATTRFFLYGKKHCTRTGWLANVARYPKPDPLETVDLKGRRFVVTGANSGIGRETTQFLASHGGTVYMVCRNEERGRRERDLISKKTGNDDVRLLIGNCGVASDIRRVVTELEQQEEFIDCLMCNAGALSNERSETSEGIETTFATHLLCGTYMLIESLRPLLTRAAQSGRGPRVVVVSSGGMYNVKYDHALATGAKGSYDGQLSYAYAKRGQVILCEQLALAETDGQIRFVSCHPGWTDTPGVESAYGARKSYLQPLRSLWEGSEGIIWLCATSQTDLQNGAFYLDRSPQETRLVGWMFNSFTQNTPEEKQAMMASLQAMATQL
eukprot:TRINITY_DN50492_c0_g1_i1.p1 TRINITY_DN50492_c0_g1~~TRINITY_DN50492_c0_g1_i1.p1  ORF type:complete len:330 (-),score=47.22 TRINITY_DN50492_c0_g1_i1:146-1135(-)